MAKTRETRETVKVEELLISHSLQLTALVELLEERGLFKASDILERMRAIRDRKKPN